MGIEPIWEYVKFYYLLTFLCSNKICIHEEDIYDDVACASYMVSSYVHGLIEMNIDKFDMILLNTDIST